jgi:hypothetical protein
VERCQTGLCVCGDESVGALENDSFVAETYDLGIPTTTDKEEIRAFLSKPVLRTADHLHDLPEPLKARRGCTGSRGYFRFRCLGRGSSHRGGAASKTFATLLRDDAVASSAACS